MKFRDHCWLCNPRSLPSKNFLYLSVLDYRYKLVLVQALSRLVTFPASVCGHHAILTLPNNGSIILKHIPLLLFVSSTKMHKGMQYRFMQMLLWEKAVYDDPKWQLRRRLGLGCICCVLEQETLLSHCLSPPMGTNKFNTWDNPAVH